MDTHKSCSINHVPFNTRRDGAYCSQFALIHEAHLELQLPSVHSHTICTDPGQAVLIVDNLWSIIYADTMEPLKIIKDFDEFLSRHGQKFEAVCIGGTALALLGIISRETQDCDVLEPQIPGEIKRLSKVFSREMSEAGVPLKEFWLNNGPASLIKDLPKDWQTRTQLAFQGKALKLSTLGRQELLMSKVFALCDRAVDLPDCLAMAPTREELLSLLPWLEERDGNPQWAEYVREVMADLAKKLGYEL